MIRLENSNVLVLALFGFFHTSDFVTQESSALYSNTDVIT